MRRPLPLALAVVTALGLAACSSADPTPDPVDRGPAACADGGSAVDSVDVTGDFGRQPTVSFESPLSVDATERAVAIQGDGDLVELGGTLSLNVAVYDGSTGEVATSTGFQEAGALLAIADPDQVLPGIASTVLCSTVGSRVVGVVAPEDAFGANGYADLGIGPDTTLVLVIDIVDVVGEQAEGEPRDLPADFPALGLEFADDGRPTVTIPGGEPPSDLRIGVLIEGDGPVVGPDDKVTLQYQGVNWTTGEVFDETWGDAPRSFTSVIPGFRKAFVGQPVGSRIVVVIPPAEGYGAAGNSGAGIAGTDTIVFVLDILTATPPPPAPVG